MKRCPECGFRANDVICPLCGVRMRETGFAQTHTHTQKGERCVLPNRESASSTPVREQVEQTHQRSRNTRRAGSPSGFAIFVVVIILISMFRSCMGMI